MSRNFNVSIYLNNIIGRKLKTTELSLLLLPTTPLDYHLQNLLNVYMCTFYRSIVRSSAVRDSTSVGRATEVCLPQSNYGKMFGKKTLAKVGVKKYLI